MSCVSVQKLIEDVGLPGSLADGVSLQGDGDPVLKTPFRVAELTATVLSAQGALRGSGSGEPRIDPTARLPYPPLAPQPAPPSP